MASKNNTKVRRTQLPKVPLSCRIRADISALIVKMVERDGGDMTAAVERCILESARTRGISLTAEEIASLVKTKK